MDKNNVVSAAIVRQITRMVVEELQKQQRLERSTPIGVSNRHVHLDRADMDALFGPGSELTVKKMLGQPGQYAAEETVTIRGPKGELSRVRVLGPLRAQTQVEISIADGFTLGVKPPVRESGQLKDTPGIEIIGPCGSVKKDSGVIAALPGFLMVASALKAIPDPLVGEAVAVTSLAGITGSASGGMSIALAAMAQTFIDSAQAAGIPMEVLHRIAAMASGGMDTLPHNGAVITLLAVTGLTHRQSYGDIFAITLISTLSVFLVIAVYYLTGIV